MKCEEGVKKLKGEIKYEFHQWHSWHPSGKSRLIYSWPVCRGRVHMVRKSCHHSLIMSSWHCCAIVNFKSVLLCFCCQWTSSYSEELKNHQMFVSHPGAEEKINPFWGEACSNWCAWSGEKRFVMLSFKMYVVFSQLWQWGFSQSATLASMIISQKLGENSINIQWNISDWIVRCSGIKTRSLSMGTQWSLKFATLVQR